MSDARPIQYSMHKNFFLRLQEVVLLAADCGSLECESWKPPELLCGSSKRNLHIVVSFRLLGKITDKLPFLSHMLNCKLPKMGRKLIEKSLI